MLSGRKGQPLTPEQRQAYRDLGRRESWRHGVLRYKLHADQKRVYDQMGSRRVSRFVAEIARQWGKTRLGATMAIELCLRHPGGRVPYGAPTLKMLKEFILPAFRQIIDDAPEDCKPRWSASDSHWMFPNGAHIHLFGADDLESADRGRGPNAVAAFFDEGGFCPVLEYVVGDVLAPQLLHSGGPLYVLSSPAREPDHSFTEMAERAEAAGNYARRTIFDNPLLTPERIEQAIADAALDHGLTVEEFKQTSTYKREFLAQRAVDKHLVVIPEWEQRRAGAIAEHVRPDYFDGLVALDFGGADPHAAVFGYWDFRKARLVIEDELLLREDETTEELADAIKAKERELWKTPGTDDIDRWKGTLRAVNEPGLELLKNLPDYMYEAVMNEAPEQPYLRVSDTNTQLVRDLYRMHGIAFIPTAKDQKQLQVNELRTAINRGEVVIHPRCVHLDRHLRTTVWANDRRTDYRRKAGEHGDLVDALVYLYRNLDKSRNPYPAEWTQTDNVRHLRAPPQSEAEKLSSIFLDDSALGRKLSGR